jgi:cobalamin biosynthetic protein CobC
MARRGIWVRLFAHGVRLGLPPDEEGWHRLDDALAAWTIAVPQNVMAES